MMSAALSYMFNFVSIPALFYSRFGCSSSSLRNCEAVPSMTQTVRPVGTPVTDRGPQQMKPPVREDEPKRFAKLVKKPVEQAVAKVVPEVISRADDDAADVVVSATEQKTGRKPKCPECLSFNGRLGVSAAYDGIFNANHPETNTAQSPYHKLDILLIAFVHINLETYKLDFEAVPDGGKEGEKQRLEHIEGLTEDLRSSGNLKRIISLGWGHPFRDIPTIEEHLEVFAPSVAEFLDKNKLDGFDIDYQSLAFKSEESFMRVSKALREAIGPNKLLTITVDNTYHLNGEGLQKYYNFVNVMSYQAASDAGGDVGGVLKRMKGLDSRKVLAGADTENGDDIQKTIKLYQNYNLAGVFAWRMHPNFDGVANAMWDATQAVKEDRSAEEISEKIWRPIKKAQEKMSIKNAEEETSKKIWKPVKKAAGELLEIKAS